MPTTITTEVFTISELSDSAKERAREWYRENCLNHDWWEFVYDDFQSVCGMIGIELDFRGSNARYGILRRPHPRIYFRGFWSQGDGASFEGSYAYKKGAAQAVRSYAPKDTELHGIVDRLQALQRRHLYQLRAKITQGRFSAIYVHSNTMTVEVTRNNASAYHYVGEETENGVTQAMRDLADWLYEQLENEYEGLTSDEAADENMAANGDTFTEDGERFG